MQNAKCLRVIGQCVEAARVSVFAVEQKGQDYFLSVDSLDKTGEWILCNALATTAPSRAPRSTDNRRFCFSLADIARLDLAAQKQRSVRSAGTAQGAKSLSQALRAVGDHLDITETVCFRLSWKFDDSVLEYQDRDGRLDSRRFTIERLERLGLHSRFRRSSTNRYGFTGAKNLQPSDRGDTPDFPNWSPAKNSRFEWKLSRLFKPNKK